MLPGMEEIKPPFTRERVWEWCDQELGELAVEERLGEETARNAHRTWETMLSCASTPELGFESKSGTASEPPKRSPKMG